MVGSWLCVDYIDQKIGGDVRQLECAAVNPPVEGNNKGLLFFLIEPELPPSL